jgi:broad specificity phosphatase PhoE
LAKHLRDANLRVMRLFLIRHGQVEPIRQGTYYGGIEVPLSSTGELEARRAATFMAEQHLDYLFSSPLSRARYGAEQLLLGRSDLPWTQEDSFREINRGSWVGLTPAELEKQQPGQWNAHLENLESWRGNGGESLGDLRNRVLSGLEKIQQIGAGKSVALVSHMFPTRAILAEALGLNLQQWDQIKIPTASISLVEYQADGTASVKYVGHKPVS